MIKKVVQDAIDDIDHGRLPGWIADHLTAYRESGGREGHHWDATAVGGSADVPCLLLTVRGRRSGKTYTHPLVYGTDGERQVVVGSKGGADTHPQWVHNLLADPVVEVQVGEENFSGRARLAEGDERTRLWQIVADVFPPYNDYQARTEREIPLFVIERD